MGAQVHFVSTDAASYADLESVPEGWTAELVGGRLHALPRPRGRHILSASILGRRLGVPFEDGVDGPGGWWRDRLPEMLDDQKFTVIPDWICKILPPGAA